MWKSLPYTDCWCQETPPRASDEFVGWHSAILWALEVSAKATLGWATCAAKGGWQIVAEVTLAMKAPFAWGEVPASAFEVFKRFLLLLESYLGRQCWGVPWTRRNVPEALHPGCAEAGLAGQKPPLITEIQLFFFFFKLSIDWLFQGGRERAASFCAGSALVGEPPGHQAAEAAGLGVQRDVVLAAEALWDIGLMMQKRKDEHSLEQGMRPPALCSFLLS